eukprot:TRINITY_DN9538_c0_g1_i1.p1 TRINITY_DN9538_c0_g1~~TRINITY_DN9538_c0_g1_i1.p1  ORF type:complete len:230 (-),score=69.78 TRINITY_DN9538_c0_g1_i1:3-692(-)
MEESKAKVFIGERVQVCHQGVWLNGKVQKIFQGIDQVIRCIEVHFVVGRLETAKWFPFISPLWRKDSRFYCGHENKEDKVKEKQRTEKQKMLKEFEEEIGKYIESLPPRFQVNSFCFTVSKNKHRNQPKIIESPQKEVFKMMLEKMEDIEKKKCVYEGEGEQPRLDEEIHFDDWSEIMRKKDPTTSDFFHQHYYNTSYPHHLKNKNKNNSIDDYDTYSRSYDIYSRTLR